MTAHTRDEDHVLIAIVGHGDLQVLVDSGHQEVDRESTGALHASLLAALDERPDDSLIEQLPTGAARLDTRFHFHSANPLPRIVAPRLEAVVGHLGDQGIAIRAALLLATRDGKKNEPIAAAPLLCKWLSNTFGLELVGPDRAVGRGQCGWVAALQVGESLQRPGTRDDPVNRQAARRIDRAIAALTLPRAADVALAQNEPAKERSSNVWIIDGGIAQFRRIAEASARLHFHGKGNIRLWGAERGGVMEAARTPPSAVRSLDTRRHVLQLIDRGNFVGASAAIDDELAEDPADKTWVASVRSTAAVFGGISGEIAQDLLEGSRCVRSLLIGLRIEAALVGERYLEALRLTGTFRDVAVRDAIEGLAWIDRVQDHVDRIVLTRDGETLAMAAAEVATQNSTTKNALRQNKQGQWEISVLAANQSFWTKQVTASDQLVGNALSALQSAMDKGGPDDQGVFSNLRYMRNIITHSMLPDGWSDRVVEICNQAKIWATGAAVGSRFLAAEKSCNMLFALGVCDPARVYRNIVERLTNALLSYEIG
jgi:hypothetical protein